jgi:repressor LexA
MEEKFGDRLYRLRKERDLTMDELAAAINLQDENANLNKSIISRYEHNIHKPGRFTLVEDLANFFGVTTDYMMCRSDDKYGEDIKYKEIPILGTIAAGVPILAQEDVIGHEYVSPGELIDFCLKVKGDSMINARIFSGDIVFIHRQPEVENGEIAAVQIDGESATLKRVYVAGSNVILHPENPNYKDIVFSKKDKKNITILGKAVYFKSEVK